jgi:tetratricopeptide (TPR) repeat protein
MKKILFGCFLIIFSLSISAQQTRIYSDDEKLFLEGKSLHAQKKYAASTLSLENYLKTTGEKQSETVQESKYYIAVNDFELRKDIALHKLKHYIQMYPYTPFYDLVCFMIGTLEYENRNFKEAETWFRNTNADKIPNDEYDNYLFRYGYTLLQLRKYGDSKYYFAQLIEKNTRYKNAANYYYAYSEYTLKNYESALEAFSKIKDNSEYSNFVPYYIIQIYYYQKRYEELIPLAEELIKNNPKNENNPEIYRILGECYYQKKDYQQTIDYLAKYQETGKRAVRNDMYMLGISYFNLKDYENAVANLSKVTSEKDLISQNAYLHLGISYLKLDQKNNARLAFLQASKMNYDKDIKESAAYNYALTTYELSFSPFNESVLAFEDFLNNYPNSKHKEDVYNYLTNVYLTTNNYEAAFQSIAKINNPGPRLLEAKQRILFNMGIDEYTAGKYEKAIEHFTSSLELSRYNSYVAAQARYWRGDSHYKLEQYDEARKDFSDFLLSAGARMTQEFNLANYNIGYTYFNEKNYTEALIAFRKFISSENNKKTRVYIDALNRIGDSYFAQRDFNNALKFYADAADTKAPGTDYSTFQKAFVLGLQKDYNGKIRTMDELLKTFPNSEFVDDAIYEIGQAFMMLEDYDNAIKAYDKLYEKFPTTSIARKGLLQKGMLYFTINQYDNAINTYKKVIDTYPNSEEATTALESLERICIQTNQVDVYSAYIKTLNKRSINFTAEREDSLTYIAAERQYLLENYEDAAKYLSSYVKKYPNSKFSTKALYYLADSYYRLDNKAGALEAYDKLTLQEGNPYLEEAVAKAAEITYDNKDYARSLEYFKQLLTISENNENKTIARLGILRCSDFLNDAPGTISAASNILDDPRINVEQIREARYRRAKAYISLNETERALPDLKELSQEPRHIYGAEANFLLANYYFAKKDDDSAEKTIFEFIEKNTPHQYWLARSFVLLSDIYIRKGDDFQAKQYLLSLLENYKQTDSIQDMIKERLDAIEQREKDEIITDVENNEF